MECHRPLRGCSEWCSGVVHSSSIWVDSQHVPSTSTHIFCPPTPPATSVPRSAVVLSQCFYLGNSENCSLKCTCCFFPESPRNIPRPCCSWTQHRRITVKGTWRASIHGPFQWSCDPPKSPLHENVGVHVYVLCSPFVPTDAM